MTAGIITGAALALLAYALNSLAERRVHLRTERINSTVEFCRAVMDYRAAVLSAWHAGIYPGPVPDRGLPGGEAARQLFDLVRSTRSTAWAAYLHVLLVVDDEAAARACRATLDAVRMLKECTDAEQLNDEGERVRQLAEAFTGRVAARLHVSTASLDHA